MFYKIFTIIIFTLLVASVSIAQTGRVMGKVVDQQSGEPLIGANVLIIGSTNGAATDLNGNFIINQVNPGDYSLKASYLGYRDVTIKGIRVYAGLTAEVNFKLPSSSIATKEIVIISKRPIIEKSATNAIRIINSEDLESLPLRTIGQFVGLQAGVVVQDGNTYIRGSRPDETGYVLEGADVKNMYSRNGGSLVTVTPDALQEISVQAGGYTAEYGNANAGIVQESFKTGSNAYHFSLRAETDDFGNYPGNKFLGTYSYGYSDYVLTASGPITNRIKFFLSGENNFMRDFQPMFFYGNPQTYSNGALWDTTHLYDNGISGGTKGGSQIVSWKPGNIPGNIQNRYTVNGTLDYDLKPLLVRLSGAYTWARQSGPVTDIINLYNLSRLPITDQNNLLLNLKGTYLLTSNSFVDVNLNYYDRRSVTYDPNFGNNLLSYDDSSRAAALGWQYTSLTSGPSPYNFNGFPFNRPGTDITGYNKLNWTYMGGTADYTSQFGIHQLKAGGSYQYWTLRNYTEGGFGGILNAIIQNPDLARNTQSLTTLILQNSGFNLSNYGYDVFGNQTNTGQFGSKHPIFGSGYLQDRVEISDLIINAGLRYDYINMDSWSLTNPYNPNYNKTNYTIPDSVISKTKAYSYLSPRLGFSFPVTDQTIFHLQYGKFVQSPGLDVAYQGITRSAHILQGGTAYLNPVAYGLEPIRTTQYEMGFTQQISENAAFDITAFYKDINGQVQYTLQKTQAGSLIQPYAMYVNQDFATTQGIELNLRLRRIERLRAEFNYTYSDSKGTNSGTTSGFGAQQTGTSTPTVIVPLNFDETHRGSLMLDYRFAKNDGGPILERLGINILFTFNSGHPFTQDQQAGLGQNSAWTGGLLNSNDSRANRPIEPINSSTTPWNYEIDLRLDKTVTILTKDVNFYVYVQNVLNTKNVTNVYAATGNPYNDGFLQSASAQGLSPANYGSTFVDLYNTLNLGNRENQYFLNGTDLFSTPRQIRAGIVIDF